MTTPEKTHLRSLARKTLQRFSPEDIHFKSANLLQRLVDFLAENHPQAQRIATFAALPTEPDLSLLHALNPDLQLFYPRVVDSNSLTFHHVTAPSTLKKGKFNIPEPVPSEHPTVSITEFDLILVPGLAFDLQGNRLGQGAGYYDRFLAQIPLIPRIGISFASQFLPQLPAEPHDLPVQAIITEQSSRIAQRAVS